MAIDTEFFKKKLEEEKAKLEQELSGVAHRASDNPKDWEVTPPDLNTSAGSKDEDADQEEELENRTSVQMALESQFRDVNDALTRIEKGEYGTCENGGEQIPENRLQANPAARTCIEHAQ